jgi:hypothetical protein
VGDFAGCGQWCGRVSFLGPNAYTTKGAADTWSNWTKKPTGWAFTNVGPRAYNNGLDASTDTLRKSVLTLDVLNLKSKRDVSPGFIKGATNSHLGTAGAQVGMRNRMSVPVFSNGSKATGRVTVAVHSGSAHGPLVARKHVKLGGYKRKNVAFRFLPRHEGIYRLYAVVDPKRRVAEADENNNVQMTEGWASPGRGRVLVVDDDGILTQERSVEGALASLGVRYSVVTGHPTYKQLRRYKAVIWEAGVDRYEGQFNALDRRGLKRYLNNGGRLLISSNRIFDAVGFNPADASPQSTLSGIAFGAHYLGSRMPNTSYVASRERPTKASGRGLLSRRAVTVVPAPSRQFVVFAALANKGKTAAGKPTRPFGKAHGVLTARKADFPAMRPTAKPYLGIAVDGDAKHHRFKTVTLGFNLGQSANVNATIGIVSKVMTHFGVPLHRYTVHGAQAVVYDAQVRDQVSGRRTPVTAVVLGGHGKPKVTLHYRRHGRGDYFVRTMKHGSRRGTYTASIPGRAITPDGVDYYIEVRRGGHRSFSPALAGTGKVAHSIGVAPPELANPVGIKRSVATVSTAATSSTSRPSGVPLGVALLGLASLAGYVGLAQCRAAGLRRARHH